MKANRTELIVSALQNGTVIDHIPAEKLFTIASILHINELKNQVTIGNNLSSKKLGLKGIIKVSDKYFEKQELDKIALVAPTAKINIIKDYEVVEKSDIQVPDEVNEILQCVNPMCVTNKEKNVATRFHVIDKKNLTCKCHYCERIINQEDLIILK